MILTKSPEVPATKSSPRAVTRDGVPQPSQGPWLAGALGAFVAQLWFRGGAFLAGGDIPPFETTGLRNEITSLWNHQATGDGSAGYVIGRWPEVLVSAAARGAGFGGPIAQRAFYGACVGLCAGAAGWAAAAVVRRRSFVVISALFVILSPLSMVSLPSHLTFVASAAMALGTGLGLRTWQGMAVPWWPWVTLAVTCGYLTVNPPLLILALLWAAACVGTGAALALRGERWSALLRCLPGAAAATAVSLYWVVPFAFTILSPSESASFVAQTDVSQWAWTHARASILNVLSLTGHWSWDHPEYHPIVTVLDRPAIAWTRYVLPLTALSAPFLIRDRRFRRLSLVLLAVVGLLVFVGKGLHGPWPGLNRLLYERLPGFWLLREPVPKISTILLPLLALLWAMALDGFAARALVSRRAHNLLPVVVAAAVAFPVAFGLPLIDGRALRQEPGESVWVTVPDEWEAAAAAVDEASSSGKVVQLPLADYYQLPTTWGYYGADTTLKGLARRPVVTRSPGGYFSSRSVVDRLLDDVERGVLEGDGPSVEEAMRRLGASVLVVRSDLMEDSPNRSFTPSGPLVAGLNRLPNVTKLHDGSLVDVVEMPTLGLASTYSVVQRSSDPGMTLQPDVAALAATAPGLGSDGDELEGGVAVHGSADGLTVQTRRAGEHAIKLAAGVPLSFDIEPRGDRAALVPRSQLEVDGALKDILPVTDLGAEGEVRALRVGERLIVQNATPAPFQIASGSTIMTLRSTGGPQRLPDGEPRDCARTDDRSLAEVGIAVDARPDGDLLTAREHRACLHFGVEVPAGASALQLVVLGRGESGPPAPPCVLIDESLACEPPGPEELLADGARRVTVPLTAGASSISVFEYAEPGNPVLWRRPTLEWLTAAAEISLPDAQAVLDLRPGVHHLGATGAGGSHLGERSGVSNCGEAVSPREAGMSLEDAGSDGFTLHVAQQRACTTVPIKNLGEDAAIHFEVRGAHPSVGGYCVWWDTLRTCGKADSFEVGDGWRGVDIEVDVPAGVNEGRLFLYASPGTSGPGGVSYRSLRVRDVRSMTVTVGPTGQRPRAPVATPVLERRHGAGAAIEVPARSTPVLVRYAEGYSTRWIGSVGGREVPHAKVDGFANGWVVPASDVPVTLEVRYGPQTSADLALACSIVAFLALVGWGLARRVRRSKNDREDGHLRARAIGLSGMVRRIRR